MKTIVVSCIAIAGVASFLALRSWNEAHFYEQQWRNARNAHLEDGQGSQKKTAVSNDAGEVPGRKASGQLAGSAHGDPALAFISPEKQELLASLSKYDLRRDKLLNPPGGILLKDDLEELKRLDAEKRDLLASVLSPAELEHYQLQAHPIAETMRRDLAAFQPTEEEFRKIFALQKQESESIVELQLEARANPDAPSQGLKMAAIAGEAEKAIAETLGPERYAVYQRSRDPEFVVLRRISEQFGLPDALAIRAYQARKASEQEFAQLHEELKQQGEPTPAVEQWLNERLLAIRQKEEAALRGALGTKGFEAFTKNNPGTVQAPRTAMGK
jgi:hypothetical protein